MPEPMRADPEMLADWPRVPAVLFADAGPVMLELVAWPTLLQSPSGKAMVGVSLCVLDAVSGTLTQVAALPERSVEVLSAELLRAALIAREAVGVPDLSLDPNPPALDLSKFPVPPPSDTP